ncbi:MAG: C40 family peptidase [Thermodesulfovibrionia bacterium]
MGRMTFLFAFIFILILPLQGMAQKTYTVKKGDNLHRISKRFNVRIEELKEANDLKSNKIKVGARLIIPDDADVRDNPVTMSISSEGASPSIKKEAVIYTVKRGDTLWGIARRFNINVKELKRINGIRSNILKPQQELVVGYKVVEEVKSDVVMEIEGTSQSPEIQSMSRREQMVFFAKKMLGISYRFGGNAVNVLDCSSFVQRVFEFVGIALPRTAREQFNLGIPISKDELSVGDLLFFKTYAPFPSHVGIYLGNDLFIHASASAKKVTIDNLNTPYYLNRFIGAKRLPIDEAEQ